MECSNTSTFLVETLKTVLMSIFWFSSKFVYMQTTKEFQENDVPYIKAIEKISSEKLKQ